MGPLEMWRRGYWDGDLEVPHGFVGEKISTAVAEKDGKQIASLTGLLSVVLDPFIHDPNAANMDVISALIKLETALTYLAQADGAVDAYIAIPEQLTGYIRLLEGYGFKTTCQHCVIMRRPLIPDTVPLLGEERDRLMREAQAERTETTVPESSETELPVTDDPLPVQVQ